MIFFSKFQIVSKPLSLSESIHSHKDLDKGSAPLYSIVVKFYEDISKQLVNQGHVLDLFACALDQVGVVEMKVVVGENWWNSCACRMFWSFCFKRFASTHLSVYLQWYI